MTCDCPTCGRPLPETGIVFDIEAARKTARASGKTACTGDMQRKRKALLVAHKMLMAMLGIEP